MTQWEKYWETEAAREHWQEPETAVIEFFTNYGLGHGDRILDMGCGIGRHALRLAESGAEVCAVDEAPTAIRMLLESARTVGLEIEAKTCNYLDLDAAGAYDYILAYNVLYHGDREHFRRSIDKCRELLFPGGRLLFTCPSRKDAKYGSGREVAPHTWESANSLHPGDIHYFTTPEELSQLLSGFEDVDIRWDEETWNHNGEPQFASNMLVTARRAR